MAEEHKPVSYRSYFVIWLALSALSGLNVWIAGLAGGSLTAWIILAVASLQAGLVLSVFMHLNQETKMFRLGILALLIIVAVSIGLTFVDVLYR
ncbi:MAG: cytochrome C oxidase subunit IV family protein [Desulfuromonadales bacterium]|nr:cytochrome C oxidase subunit IV family protein [Desulfuromonadales bacterium]MBN2791342.1 cytochrome C oxidase subunit IV family protein [Desulfuromonadales bacterium]